LFCVELLQVTPQQALAQTMAAMHQKVSSQHCWVRAISVTVTCLQCHTDGSDLCPTACFSLSTKHIVFSFFFSFFVCYVSL